MNIFLTFIFFLLTLTSQSQSLSYFKEKTDKIIKSYFVSSSIEKINCEGFEFRTFCHGDAAMHLFCNSIEYPGKLDNEGCKFVLAGISYSIYSSELREKLCFTISIDSNSHEDTDSIISKIIPECIRENGFCNYISKDRALKIATTALKNKVLFTVNFIKNKLDGQYYWETVWITKNKSSNTSIIRINATSGKIIKPKHFISN